MRKIISLALFALATTITVSAWGADNSLGTWKANVAKCEYTPAPWPVEKPHGHPGSGTRWCQGDEHGHAHRWLGDQYQLYRQVRWLVVRGDRRRVAL